MAKSELKIQARALRLQGKRIKEIANELGVSKGSVSIWCDDIVLTPEQKFAIEQNSSTLLKKQKSGPGQFFLLFLIGIY